MQYYNSVFSIKSIVSIFIFSFPTYVIVSNFTFNFPTRTIVPNFGLAVQF